MEYFLEKKPIELTGLTQIVLLINTQKIVSMKRNKNEKLEIFGAFDTV